MKITRAHYEFYCQKRTKVSWYKPDLSKIREVSIHSLIPQDDKRDKDFAIHNTMSILKGCRRREGTEGLVKALIDMWKDPGTIIYPKKRSNFCYRCLKKMGKVPVATDVTYTLLQDILRICEEYKNARGYPHVRTQEK